MKVQLVSYIFMLFNTFVSFKHSPSMHWWFWCCILTKI